MIVRATCGICRSLYLTEHPPAKPHRCPHCLHQTDPQTKAKPSKPPKRRRGPAASKDKSHGTRSSP